MSTNSSRGATVLNSARQIAATTRDPRFAWWRLLALALSLLLVMLAVGRIPGNDWGLRFQHSGLHLFVVAWFCLASYRFRTVGAWEIVRFWLMGFFPIILAAYILAQPFEWLFGTGNLQTGFLVPLIEESVKTVPLILWATLLRSRHHHGTLTDFWLLGFALGAGVSFHEDALYGRLASSGFGDGLAGTLFPMIYTDGKHVITHAGWTAIAGVGIGLWATYRTRIWSYPIAAALIGFTIVDHAAANWRGTGTGVLRAIVFDGHTGEVLLALTVLAAIGHDWFALRWAGLRDNLFPEPQIRDDVRTLAGETPQRRIGGLAARQRYRRLRNAAFADLYRVRSTGRSAGDRSRIVAHLRQLRSATHARTVDPPHTAT